MPSNRIVSTTRPRKPPDAADSARLHVGNGGELDVVELSADPLDPAHIHVLDEVAGLRVERHGSSRARPTHALHGVDERLAAGAVRLLQALVDEMHAVIAANGHEIG